MRFVQASSRQSAIEFPRICRLFHHPEKLLVRFSSQSDPKMNRQLLHLTLEVRRHPRFYVFYLVTPMNMVAVTSLASLLLPAVQIRARLAVSLTAVLMAVALTYDIMQTVPQFGRYVTWLSRYIFSCFFFLCVVVMQNCIAYGLPDFDLYGLVILIGVFVASNLYFCIIAIRAYGLPSKLVREKLRKKESLMFLGQSNEIVDFRRVQGTRKGLPEVLCASP